MGTKKSNTRRESRNSAKNPVMVSELHAVSTNMQSGRTSARSMGGKQERVPFKISFVDASNGGGT